MPDYDFSQADAVVIDPQPNTLRLLQDVLGRLGVRRVQGFSDIAEAESWLRTAMPDLLLVDADLPDSPAFRFIRSLRLEAATGNPFLGIMVTTWNPTAQLLSRIANSGADELIIKPVSSRQMQARLLSLVEGRKKFVVTSDFIGPDRRRERGEPSRIPLVDVPNTLRLKVTGMAGQVDARDLIDRVQAQVDGQKRVRDAIQIAFLVEFAMPGLSRLPYDTVAVDHVGRIPEVAADLLARLPAGPARQEAEARQIEALCGPLNALARQVLAGEAIDSGALSKAAYAVVEAVIPDRSLPEVMREVGEAVAGYRTRLEQIAATKAAMSLTGTIAPSV